MKRLLSLFAVVFLIFVSFALKAQEEEIQNFECEGLTIILNVTLLNFDNGNNFVRGDVYVQNGRIVQVLNNSRFDKFNSNPESNNFIVSGYACLMSTTENETIEEIE